MSFQQSQPQRSSSRRDREIESERPRETPDWPAELAEPVARLGPPNDVFRIGRDHALRKTFYGVGLLTFGTIGNFVYWVIWNGPFIAEHFLLVALFGPMISGAGFLYAAWRDRGLWVLSYPMGLLRWQRGQVVTFPWDEIDGLSFFRVVECERLRKKTDERGEWIAAWLPVAKMGSRTLGAHLILRRNDGATAILPSALSNFSRLCRIVQEETFRRIWDGEWRQLSAGRTVKFADLSVGRKGIDRGGKLLAWDNLAEVLIQNGKLIIRAERQRRPWHEIPLHNIDNPHVLVAFLVAGTVRSTDRDSGDRE